jgi:hypothetical protein
MIEIDTTIDRNVRLETVIFGKTAAGQTKLGHDITYFPISKNEKLNSVSVIRHLFQIAFVNHTENVAPIRFLKDHPHGMVYMTEFSYLIGNQGNKPVFHRLTHLDQANEAMLPNPIKHSLFRTLEAKIVITFQSTVQSFQRSEQKFSYDLSTISNDECQIRFRDMNPERDSDSDSD